MAERARGGVGRLTVKLWPNSNYSFGASSRPFVQTWIVALLETFQVSFSLIGNAHTSSAGSYVVSTFVVYDALNVPTSVQIEPVIRTVRTSRSSARSEARYSVYPSTVAFSMKVRLHSMIVALPKSPLRARSIRLSTWNNPCTLTLYCPPSAAVTVRVTLPATTNVLNVGRAEDAFTWYVQKSPTCHVGTPIDEACGVFPPVGDPRFMRVAGPRATAAIASDAKS